MLNWMFCTNSLLSQSLWIATCCGVEVI
jgi:hypothetical protein